MYLKNSTEMQKKIRNSRLILPGLLSVIGIYYVSYLGDTITGLYIFALALGWSFTSPMVMKFDMRRQILLKYTDKEKVNLFGHYKLTIEPQMLTERSPSGKNKMLWGDLLRVEYGDKYVYIYIDIDTALIIPTETISKGNLEAFAEEAERQIEKFE
jgi:hypothetical protein